MLIITVPLLTVVVILWFIYLGVDKSIKDYKDLNNHKNITCREFVDILVRYFNCEDIGIEYTRAVKFANFDDTLNILQVNRDLQDKTTLPVICYLAYYTAVANTYKFSKSLFYIRNYVSVFSRALTWLAIGAFVLFHVLKKIGLFSETILTISPIAISVALLVNLLLIPIERSIKHLALEALSKHLNDEELKISKTILKSISNKTITTPFTHLLELAVKR